MRQTLPAIALGIGISLCAEKVDGQEDVDSSFLSPDDTFYFQDRLLMKVAQLHCLAQNGEQSAQYELGLFYRDGFGVKQRAAQAIYWLEQAAAQGHADASYDLGMMYAEWEEGDEALRWMGIAATRGNAKAQKVYNYILNNDFGYGC